MRPVQSDQPRLLSAGVALLVVTLMGVGVSLALGELTPTDGQPPASASASTVFDRWYAVYLADQRVGWSRATVREVSDPPSIVTSSQIKITVRRGQVEMTITADNMFVETPDGKPIRAESRQQLGRMGVSQSLTFDSDGVELVTTQGGREVRRRLPTPRARGGESWLPPAAAHRFVERQMADGAEQFSCWTLDPSLGTEPFRFDVIQRGSEPIEVFGKVVPATAWDTTVLDLAGDHQPTVCRCARPGSEDFHAADAGA